MTIKIQLTQKKAINCREKAICTFMAQNDFATNGNDGEAMFQNARWSLGTEWRLGYNDMHGYEVETHLGRYIGKCNGLCHLSVLTGVTVKWEWMNTKPIYSDKK
jgi:hypothetical protein